jgi:hypothetical protein
LTDLFGNYKSQTTRALGDIQSSKYPDTNKDMEKNIQRLNQFVDYIAQYLTTMQKGVDQANEDPITKLRSTILDMGSLLGGGELLYGINLGDLQYFLPAIGAMFGFDASQPFPLNLLYAAEHFFLGFIVPLDAWAPAVIDIIKGWATALGLSPEFMQAVEDLLNNMGRFTTDLGSIFNDFAGLLGVFNIFDPLAGPIGPLWHALTQLLAQFNFTNLGHIVDPFLETLTPWIELLAQIIGAIDDLMEGISSGLGGGTGTFLNPQTWISNILSIFGNPAGLLDGSFNPMDIWNTILSQFLGPIGLGNFLGPISVGSLTSNNPNWIVNGTFKPGAIAPNSGGWIVDTTKNRTAGDNTGSATIVADGTLHSLNTGDGTSDRKAVGKGQIESILTYVSHEDAFFGGAGAPVLLRLRRFNGDVELDAIELASYTPNTTNVAFPGLPLTGQYLIPDGVTHIVGNIQVTENALGGTWHFDEAEGHSDVDISVMPSFGNAITTLDQKGSAILDMIASATKGIPIVGGGLAAAEEGLKNFNPLNILGPLGGVNIGADIQGFMNMFVGGARGKPVTSDVSMADVYIAASQAITNVAGSDVTKDTSVSVTIPIDASWTNHIDIAGVGKGGNGLSLGPFQSAGHPGIWNAITWDKGTHYDGTLTGVIITKNSDGSYSAAIPGHTVNFAAGANADLSFNNGTKGTGPGILVYNLGNYVGGETQNAIGGNGLAPGGAGAAGSLFKPAGVGAPGRVWVRARGTAGASTSGDTTPPSLPNWDVVATKDSLSFKGRDSIDA